MTETLGFLSVWIFYHPYIGGAIFIAIGILVLAAIDKAGALI